MSQNHSGATALSSTAHAALISETSSLRGVPSARTLLLGRLLGLGMLIAFGLGMYSNFQLQNELFAAPGVLVRAAAMPLHIGAAVLIGLITAVISVTIAVALRGLYGHHHPLLSRCFLALVTAGLASSLFESSLFLTMRDVSEAFLAAGSNTEAFEPARALLRGLRNGAHYPDKLLGGICVTLMYLLMFRVRAIPRWLAIAGIVAGVLQWIAVARELFGLDVIYALLAPLALVYPLTGLWLLARGLAVPEAVAPSIETQH